MNSLSVQFLEIWCFYYNYRRGEGGQIDLFLLQQALEEVLGVGRRGSRGCASGAHGRDSTGTASRGHSSSLRRRIGSRGGGITLSSREISWKDGGTGTLGGLTASSGREIITGEIGSHRGPSS